LQCEIRLTACDIRIYFISLDALASNFTISVRNYFTSSKARYFIKTNDSKIISFLHDLKTASIYAVFFTL